jgi:hypothetical protein
MKTLQNKLESLLVYLEKLEDKKQTQNLVALNEKRQEQLEYQIDVIGFIQGKILECIDEI